MNQKVYQILVIEKKPRNKLILNTLKKNVILA